MHSVHKLMLWGVSVMLLACASRVSGQSQPAEGICASRLGEFVAALLEKPENRRALYGILVRKASGSPNSTEAPLYANNAASRFTPASNTKLFSAGALFLHTDASAFRYATSFLFRNTPEGAQLCVRGSGDPSLTHTDLRVAAEAIQKLGVKSVSDLSLDNSLFQGDGQPFPSSWEYDDLNWYYGAEPQALIVEQNAVSIIVTAGQEEGQPLSVRFAIDDDADVVEVRIAGRTLAEKATANLTAFYPAGNQYIQIEGGLPAGSNPASLSLGVINSTARFGNLFKNILQKQGIKVERVSIGGCSGAGWSTAHTHRSDPLSVLMDHCLQVSDNLYAEVFARTLGAHFAPHLSSGSTLRDGLDLIAQSLEKLGVDPQSFMQADGSGLSRHNMLSPESLADMLNGLHAVLSPERFKLFKSFLPLAGKSGSLINRFKGTPAEGKVWAKTGSMTGVTSLSGYAENPIFPHQMLIFSIIVNGNSLGQAVARAVTDQIVETLVELRAC